MSKKTKKKSALRELIELALFVLGIVLTFKYIGRTNFIPSASMSPTLEPGDYVVTNKLASSIEDFSRGDMIIFNLDPTRYKECNNTLVSKDIQFIKRVVALPGETMSIENNVLTINGEVIPQDFILEPMQYTWPEYTVPEGTLIVLGDNRNDSCDSSVWGPIPSDQIVGKVALPLTFPQPVRDVTLELSKFTSKFYDLVGG